MRNRGLTLIEFIIATTIAGVILVMTVPMIAFAYQSYRTANFQFRVQYEAFSAIKGVLDNLRRGGGLDYPTGGFSITGETVYWHELTDYSTPPVREDFDPTGSAANYETCSVARVPSSRQLHYYRDPIDIVLARNVESVTFSRGDVTYTGGNDRNDLVVEVTCSEGGESASVRSHAVMRCRRVGD